MSVTEIYNCTCIFQGDKMCHYSEGWIWGDVSTKLLYREEQKKNKRPILVTNVRREKKKEERGYFLHTSASDSDWLLGRLRNVIFWPRK